MKKSLKFLVFAFVMATLFTACNWAPEGNGFDYKNVKPLTSYNNPPYKIVSGSKFKGIGYFSSHGVEASWRFVNETDQTLICKYAEKFYHNESHSEVIVQETTYPRTISSPKDGFEVPPGATLFIDAGTRWRTQGGGSEDFFKFYLACH